MNCDYSDIRSRIAEEPSWWDEWAVPRYCPFAPAELANIYAQECVLFVVECQACGRAFRVALSMSQADILRADREALRSGIPDAVRRVNQRPWFDPNRLEYGDPPNVQCCPAGQNRSACGNRLTGCAGKTCG